MSHSKIEEIVRFVKMFSLKPYFYINNVLCLDGLEHNLLNISQLCDNGQKVVFELNFSTVHQKNDNKVLFIAYRKYNVYTVDFNGIAKQNAKCFASFENSSWLCHLRLGHARLRLNRKLSHNDHLYGLSKLKFEKYHLRDTIQMGKQIRILLNRKYDYYLNAFTAVAYGSV